MSNATDSMPDRYRPDPWIDRTAHRDERRSWESALINLPIPTLRDWIGARPGDVLRVAPRDATTVTIGHDVPAFLGDFTVAARSKNPDTPSAVVPVFAMRYLEARPGDTMRFHKLSHGRALRLECRPDVDGGDT